MRRCELCKTQPEETGRLCLRCRELTRRIHAAPALARRVLRQMAPKGTPKPRKGRILTGAELRHAGAHGVPVWYVERYYDRNEAWRDFNGPTPLKPCSVGYYIGESDIDPEAFAPDAEVAGDFPEGTFEVRALGGQKYRPSQSTKRG